MNRPLHVWLGFLGCLVVLLAAIVWLSWTAMRLDRAQAMAQQRADFEENVRLALWRMDSALAPLIAQESSRPYFTYNSFYPAERAYNRMFNEIKKGDVLIPSPLLTQTSSNVLIHFQFGPAGELTSPEAPVGTSLELAQSRYLSAGQITLATERLKEFRTLVSPKELSVACVTTLPEAQPIQNTSSSLLTQSKLGNSYYVPPNQMEQQQALRSSIEMQARVQNYQQAANANPDNNLIASRPSVGEGALKPIWLGHALVLARRVSVEKREYLQGCWLDWSNIERGLLGSVQDILPGAQLRPVRDVPPGSQARSLAALPVQVITPPLVAEGGSFYWSPVRFSLVVAWICVLLAGLAVAGLLYGTLALSERRAAFVSAVTHELRTPLTTFKMYSEMLAEGMVPDEQRRRSYLNTLCSEANRLSHLVENVLAYARLERGSARSRVERVTLGELLQRVHDRLGQRAAQADMTIVIDSEPAALETVVHVDVIAVEQILFNLVDNACKYAAPSAVEKIIHIEAVRDGKSLMLRVRDHGTGISAEVARRLFQPFSKSANEAAKSAPGVGLGLALCRRLSRTMGGDLRWNAKVRNGACFELHLPLLLPS